MMSTMYSHYTYYSIYTPILTTHTYSIYIYICIHTYIHHTHTHTTLYTTIILSNVAVTRLLTLE